MAEIITSMTLIFVASAAMLLIANRFNQPAVPAYLTAGILISFFVNQQELLGLAQIGIAFLVFIFGLKFDPEKITAVRNEALSVNFVQILLIGTLGFAFGIIIGLDLLQAFYFAVAATFSSSLVGLELISEEVDKNLIHGRLAESIHLIQDILAVAVVVFLSSQTFIFNDIAVNLGVAATMIVSALFIRRFLFDHIANLSEGSTELLMLTGLSFLTGFIAISQYFGLSIVVGSFAAGIAVARFPHNLDILDTMGSIKDFFSAIFFVTLGALLSFPTPAALLMTAGLVLMTAFVKPALMVTSLIHQGYDPRTSFLTGVSLDQISEFTLIIAIQAWIAGMIIEPLFHAIILAATITMVSSSYTKLYEHELYELLNKYNIIESGDQILPNSNVEEELEDHIILIGYDIQGKRIVEQLEEIDAEFLIIENDPEKISDLRKKEENFVYGNILNHETWKHANPEDAKLIVSTAPFREVSEKVLTLDTNAGKILRAEELGEAENLIHKGADYVIVPEILTAELIKEHLLGIESEENYKEELRRRSLLEVRKYLESEEG
ncbi:MAG: CPA2 family monovalent cation:H+ antiporter-2 [Candidatus Nanohaloarchaea archaeon]|jgi:CPA2 family monovalent cation:H+ antiporter-2